jgi:hypothetical protein
MERIIVVTEVGLEQRARQCLENFKTQYPYLSNIRIEFTPKVQYSRYAAIRRCWSEHAEIVDTRDLPEHQNEPVRLLLTKQFLQLSQEEQMPILLHEMGHYLTNPRLLEIRRYISQADPPILSAQGSSRRLVELHNKALNYVFQLLKLPQEVNAECWLYKNHRDIAEARMENYRRSDIENLQLLRGLRPNAEFFYDIPQIVFLVSWKQAFLKHMDFEFVSHYLKEIENMWDEFLRLAKTVSLNQVKIIILHDQVLATLEYRNEKFKRLIQLYEEILREFITMSASFFSIDVGFQILKLYGLSD